MSSTEGQLISFFVYSFVVYPVVNYLVSPQRKYSRWRGVFYAIAFLGLTSYLHLGLESKENGPNHYILLHVNRSTSTNELKKAYRYLSRELHPDRNKSPTAADDFGKVKHAFDVLVNPESRSIYDRLGDQMVKVASQTVIDNKYLVIQMMVYYFSTSILAFFMTFSEPSGEAFSISVFAMAVMLVIEIGFVLKEYKVPAAILPTTTPHELISLCHRIFPAFMSGCRCIVGAFYTDLKHHRLELLEPILTRLESNHNNILYIMHTQLENIEFEFELRSTTNQPQQLQQIDDGGVSSTANTSLAKNSCGYVERAEKLSICQGSEPLLHQSILDKLKAIKDSNFLVKRNNSGLFELLRNYTIYFLIRLMVLKFTKPHQSAKG